MAEILATKTSLPGREMPGTFEAARAEALFVSTLQPSGVPSPSRSVAPSRRRCSSWESATVPHGWLASSVTTRTPR